MKYIKKYNEEFFGNSIEDWCEEFKLYNFIINKDNTVDVDSHVFMQAKRLDKIPIKFGIVEGSFNCSDNKLTTLENSPNKIKEYFTCNRNKITSLDGVTPKIGSSFYCSDNKLTSLKGGPEMIGQSYYCSYNNLTSLGGCPKEIVVSFYCGHNKLTNLIGGPIEVGESYNCTYNNLISLEGYPKKIGSHFFCLNNPIHVIYQLFNHNYEKYQDSLDYNYLRGTNIIKLRFQEALDEAGIEMPRHIKGYKYI